MAEQAPQFDSTEGEQTYGVKGSLDYKTLVFLQINRCGQIYSTMPKDQGGTQIGATYEAIVGTYTNSVRHLECLLALYIDPDCQRELEEAKRVYSEKIQDRDVDVLSAGRDMYFERFSALIKLCGRLTLLLPSIVEEYE